MVSKNEVGEEGPGAECIATGMLVVGMLRGAGDAVIPLRSVIGKGGVVGSGASKGAIGSELDGVPG